MELPGTQAAEQKDNVTTLPTKPGTEAPASKDAPPPAAAEKKEEPLSSKFAALARKEKAAHKALEEAKARLKEIDEKLARVKEYESIDNPLDALKKIGKGWTYQDLTDFVLNNQNLTPEKKAEKVEARVDGWIKQQEEEKKQAQDAETQRVKEQHEAAVSEFKENINDFVGQRTEEYELINLYEQQDMIYQTIEAHWIDQQEKYKQDPTGPKPKILSVKEAADLVEKHLEDLADKALKTKKIGSRFTPAEASTEKKTATGSTTPRTLSNDMGSSAASLLPAKTEQDRLQRALAALEKGK